MLAPRHSNMPIKGNTIREAVIAARGCRTVACPAEVRALSSRPAQQWSPGLLPTSGFLGRLQLVYYSYIGSSSF